MKRFEKIWSDYKGKIPRIMPMYAGYKGLKRGLCIIRKGKGLVLIRPLNERGE